MVEYLGDVFEREGSVAEARRLHFKGDNTILRKLEAAIDRGEDVDLFEGIPREEREKIEAFFKGGAPAPEEAR